MTAKGRRLILLWISMLLAAVFFFPAATFSAGGDEEWCPDEPSESPQGVIEGGTGTGGTQAPIGRDLSLSACVAGEVRDSTGACVCAPAQERVGGLCTPVCGPGEIREESTGKCVCSGEYERIGDQCLSKCADDEERIDGLCVARCGANEERNARGICVCREGFEPLEGLCYRRCGPNEHHGEKGDCICDEGFERVGSLCLVPCGTYETRGPDGECICLSGYRRSEDGSCGPAEDEGPFRAEEEVSGEQAEEVASEPAVPEESGPFIAGGELTGEEAEGRATAPAPSEEGHFTAEGEVAGEAAERRAGPVPTPQTRQEAGRGESSWERFAEGFGRGLREGSTGGAATGEARKDGEGRKPYPPVTTEKKPPAPSPKQPPGPSPQTGNWQALWAGHWRGSGTISATDMESGIAKSVSVSTTVIIKPGAERGGFGTIHAEITIAGKDETTGVAQRDSIEGALQLNVRNPNVATIDKTISVEGQNASTKAVLRLEGGVMRGDIRQSADGGASTVRIMFTANRVSR